MSTGFEGVCCRFETIQKMKSIQAQCSLMDQLVSQLKKDKEQATKSVKDLGASQEKFIQQIRVS